MSIAFFPATIFTGESDSPFAEALLIENQTITAVGTASQIQALAKPDTQKIRLPGCCITPGFVDAHTHVWSLGYTLTMVDLRGLTSLKACQEAIQKAADKARPGQWILGRNWNQNIWKEKRDPTRHDLDLVCPDNPAVMIRICGHANWANTRALELAGLSEKTPEPFGGRIDREPGTLYPSGVIRESRELVERAIPAPETEARIQAFLQCQDLFLANGITCVHSFETLLDYQVIHRVQQQGLLKMRVYHTVHPDELTAFDRWDEKHHSQTDMLWHGHIKMFADGSLGAKSAFLHDPYEQSQANCGIACMTFAQMQESIEKAYETGRSVIVHAIGDKALTQSLDAIEAARKCYEGPHRDRIEHLQLARPEDLERMKQMDIAASVQPMAILTDWQVAETLWGPARCRNAYAWKRMEDLGLRLIFSSDAPIEPIPPMAAIQAAVTRKGPGLPQGGWHPEQRISVETALGAYFKEGGWATGKPELFGSIAPGKRADLTVLSQNPFQIPEDQIQNIQVNMTVVNGQIVFQKDGVV